jgi:hypothetical protein
MMEKSRELVIDSLESKNISLVTYVYSFFLLNIKNTLITESNMNILLFHLENCSFFSFDKR